MSTAQYAVTAVGVAAIVWVLWYFLYSSGPPIAAGGTAGYRAMYFSPTTPSTVSTGDVLRLSTVSYPNGYQVQIVSGSSVVYTHALQ